MADEIKKEFDTVRENVIWILREDERARNSDKWLLIRYWQDVNKVNCFIPYDQIQNLTLPETIRRVRQHLQAEGHYPPTDQEVIKQRAKREEGIRRYFRG